MNKFNLQQIQGNGADEIASTGFELVRAFNGNFTQVKEAIENLDNRLFHDLSITAMAELDNLRSGSYRIILPVAGGVEYFYLLCTTDPDGKTIRQTRVANAIYTRTYAESAWSKWQYIQESFLKSEYGSETTVGVTQAFFTNAAQYVTCGKIDISQGFTALDDYNNPRKCGWYVLMSTNSPAYHLLVTSDNMNHVITQFLFGNCVPNAEGNISAHVDGKTTILIRTYNISAPNMDDIPYRRWGKWKYYQETFLKSELGDSLTDTVTQKFFTDQAEKHFVQIVDFTDIDALNNLKSLGHYHVYSGKKPMHELIVTSDSMYHTIIQFMFSNYTVKDGNLNAHQDNIATIVYRVYNLDAPMLSDIPRGTWGEWKKYGQNYEVLSEIEFDNLEAKNSEVFYYTFEDEEEDV